MRVFLGEAAGVSYSSPTGAALTVLLFLTAGLGSARLLGVVLDGGLSAYTVSVLLFEGICAVTAFFLLRDVA